MLNNSIKIFYFFAFLPAISPLPLSTDIQPTAFLLALFIMILYFLNHKFSISKFELFFFLFALYTFIRFHRINNFILDDRLGLLAAFLVYFISNRTINKVSKQLILFISVLNLVGLCWHKFSLGTFLIFTKFFIRHVKILDDGTRGLSGFAPEPGFTAAISITLIVSSYFLFLTEKINRREVVILITLNLVSLVFTKSGTGYAYFSIILFLFLLFHYKKLLISIFLLLFVSFNYVLIGISEVNFENRGQNLIKSFIENPEILLIDGATSERLIGFHVGVLSLKENFLGRGGGSYSIAAKEIESKYKLLDIYKNTRFGAERSSSALGIYFVEFGIFSLFFFILLIFRFYKFTFFSSATIFLVFIFLAFSFSVAFPPTYVLLAMAKQIVNFKKTP